VDCHCGCHRILSALECMAGTTGLEPATSAVTGQRSDQLSYVPRLFFNNLSLCHIESESSQLSLFSLCSTYSLLWTQFRAFLDTKWTPNRTPKEPTQRQDQVYQTTAVWCPPQRSPANFFSRKGLPRFALKAVPFRHPEAKARSGGCALPR
jgi:hypothetical protein